MPKCDMSQYPVLKYFQQYEIPEFGPTIYDYEYTRLLVIRAQAVLELGTSDVYSLTTIKEEIDDGGVPGIAKSSASWESIVATSVPKLHANLAYEKFISSRGTPFDFTLYNKSRIIVIIEGGFWTFSRKLNAITTKHQYGSQYFDPKRHFWNGGEVVSVKEKDWVDQYPDTECNCVSFFCDEPCMEKFDVVHGLSFNIELKMNSLVDGEPITKWLPITIDPDVENKGGNPGP